MAVGDPGDRRFLGGDAAAEVTVAGGWALAVHTMVFPPMSRGGGGGDSSEEGGAKWRR